MVKYASQQAAKNRYNAKTYDTISFRIKSDGSDDLTRDVIKSAADAAGLSFNAFCVDALKRAVGK